MISRPARRVFGLAAAGCAVAWAGSCASDPGLEDDGKGSGGVVGDSGLEGGDSVAPGGQGGGSGATGGTGATPDGSPWPGSNVGDPCNLSTDCGTLDCIGGICTFPCQSGTGCPSGSYCGFHSESGYVCVPEGTQCSQCVSDAECPNARFGDRCAIAPKSDRFCARDCSFDGTCPAGQTCVDVAGYSGGVGGGADAGVGEAGAPKSEKMCVPDNDESCACDMKRDGVTRTCEAMSGGLTCGGTEECDGASGKWSACDAGTPQPEVCDGADNDCNGTPDDGDPAMLCSKLGMPANATLACDQGHCIVDSCSPGFTNYPPTLPPSAGCPCEVDASEPNDACADATAAGSVTDASTTPLIIAGRLSEENDVDWYTIDTVDSDEGTTNSYHIHIEFTAPSPTNDEFSFDVIRGSTCATPDAKHSGLIEYDWCVDGMGTGVGGEKIGEAACGTTASIHCGPHDKPYLIAVRRQSSATGTCAEYQLSITAKGGGSCDFSQTTGACDPQIDDVM